MDLWHQKVLADRRSFFVNANFFYDACRDPRSVYYNTNSFPPICCPVVYAEKKGVTSSLGPSSAAEKVVHASDDKFEQLLSK